MRELPKDVLKMASGLISPSGLAGHRRQLCNVLLTKIVLFSKNHGQKQSYKHKHPQAMYDVIGRLSMASQIYLCVNFYDNKTELLFTYDIF